LLRHNQNEKGRTSARNVEPWEEGPSPETGGLTWGGETKGERTPSRKGGARGRTLIEQGAKKTTNIPHTKKNQVWTEKTYEWWCYPLEEGRGWGGIKTGELKVRGGDGTLWVPRHSRIRKLVTIREESPWGNKNERSKAVGGGTGAKLTGRERSKQQTNFFSQGGGGTAGAGKIFGKRRGTRSPFRVRGSRGEKKRKRRGEIGRQSGRAFEWRPS